MHNPVKPKNITTNNKNINLTAIIIDNQGMNDFICTNSTIDNNTVE